SRNIWNKWSRDICNKCRIRTELLLMKIALAGASGLVGTALIPALESQGHEVTRLVRTAPRVGEIEWHPNKDEVSTASLEGFDIIINLAGENVAGGRCVVGRQRRVRDVRV